MMRPAHARGDSEPSYELPDEFDEAFYRSHHPDLGSVADLGEHYRVFGHKEGRACSAAALREEFVEIAIAAPSVLEIGPFLNPALVGSNVRYFDVLDTDGLKRRAELTGAQTTHTPSIDFVSPNGDLSIVSERFGAVFSSHCIEHQPDLVRHLNQVSEIIEPGGRYFLIVPDKRFCFDHFIAPSTIAGVLSAHSEGRWTHTLASVVEHRALTTHNDTARHWLGDHSDADYEPGMESRIKMALLEFERGAGAYIDVHAWQFTPETFRDVIGRLNALGLIDLCPERVYETPDGRNEFTAVLRKS